VLAALTAFSADMVLAQPAKSGATRPATADTALMAHAARLGTTLARTLGVKPGTKVVIRGGTRMIPVMENLAIEARRLGGRTWMLLTSDRVGHFTMTEMPEQFLGAPPTAIDSAVLNLSDLYIELPTFSDPSASAAPPDRTAKQNASQPAFNALFASARSRHVIVGIPQPSDTVRTGEHYGSYERMTWDAMSADYASIARTGEALRTALAHARRIHVTSPEGTDFTVEMGERPVFTVDAMGMGPSDAALPAGTPMIVPGGTFGVVPNVTTASGRVRASADICDHAVKDEALDVRNGVAEHATAATDADCVKQAVEGAPFGALAIGLNPTVRPSTPTETLAQIAAGFVGLVFGNNLGLGGSQNDPHNWFVPLLHATVDADGTVLVRDGRLVVGAR
jgi:leucyl aminopeptidase (aminopeptidase T)